LYKTAYDNRQIKEWERTRTLAYMIYRSNSAEKNPKSIKTFFPLPSDEVEVDESPKISDEQLQRTLKLYGVK
jgi:hypothetical protein